MKIYNLFEVHYINNERFLKQVNTSDDLEYLLKLKKILSDKYPGSIYRIYEAIL